VADGRGSPELDLTAAPGHGGLPRGWQGKGGDATGGPAHQSLDSGEEVVHRRWDFGSKQLRRGREWGGEEVR
jgi:hypothetical protein